MIHDISSSQIIIEEYLRNQKIKNTESEIKVLTQGNWPVQSRVQIKIPEPLNFHLNKFSEYYKMKHQGKILKWNPFLSFWELEGTFDTSKPKQRVIIIEVNLLQAAVLMLFNEKDTYSFEEIMADVDVDEDTLESVLVSLCSMQYKVLKKSDKSIRNVKHDESFSVDDGFRPKLK